MLKKIRRTFCVVGLLVLAAFGLIACKPQSPKDPSALPCSASIVARYTAEMVAAGCTGAAFYAAKCEPIKAKRDADEKAAGCL